MLEFNVKADFSEVEKMLSDLEKKQLPFAMARALTKTAQDIKIELRKEMKRVFNNPRLFTLNSLYVRPARKNNLLSSVGINDFAGKGTPAADYLKAQIEGGSRKNKRFEKALRIRGLLPAGWYVVPSKKMRKNKNGNVTRGQYVKILSALGAQFDRYQNSSKQSKKIYFVARIGKAFGIWQRMKRGVKLLFVFVKRVNYKKRFDFAGVSNNVAAKKFTKNFNESLRIALTTAR